MTIELDSQVNGHAEVALPQPLPLLSPIPPLSKSSGTQRVLVVGGGPAGVVALRNLSTDQQGSHGFDAVLYERRENIGGVWFLDDDTLKLESAAGYTSQWPVPSSSHPRFPSPAYPKLIGNVYPRFLTFSGAPWPPLQGGEKFPTLEETQQYISSVAAPLRDRIKTKREVKQVWELPYLPSQSSSSSSSASHQAGGYLVLTLDHTISPPRPLYEHFSALDFCPSFTTHPSYPNVPGLAQALEQSPRKIHHAKWYRTADLFWQSKKVVVVGNGLSSNDIVAHIVLKRKEHWGEDMGATEEPVYRAIRHEPLEMFPSLPDERIHEKPYITRIDLRKVDGQAEPAIDVTFANGETLTDVDHLVWGTGYQVGIYDWVHVQARKHTQQDIERLANAGVTLSPEGWVVDSDQLAHSGFDAEELGLSDLWADLTPPARYPTTQQPTIKPQRRNLTALTAEQPVDTDWPNRVPHLHFHTVNARNPTLSFGALMVSFAPFVLADLVSHYVRSLWEGLQPLSSTSFDERRQDELNRVERLAVLKAEQEQTTPRDLILLNSAPGAPTVKIFPLLANLTFHLLGKDEYNWHLELRRRILTAKPWLSGVSGLTDEDWDPARDVFRHSMYYEKRRRLEVKEQQRKQALATQRAIAA